MVSNRCATLRGRREASKEAAYSLKWKGGIGVHASGQMKGRRTKSKVEVKGKRERV